MLSLLLVAPEISAQFPVPTALRDSFRFSREGNPSAWSQRTAHGVADFLQAFLDRAATRLSVAFTHADAADPTDCEIIDILRQRCDPDRLKIICEQGDESGDLVVGARGFLLAGSALWRGSDFEDVVDGATLLLRASDLAMRMANYDAALEWAALGRTRLDAARVEDWGKLTRNMLFARLLLDRIPEAEAICAEVQARAPEPAILAHVTYAMAILNARLYDRARHDYDAAKAWIERSLEYTERLPASETRSVNRAFLMNTMALVEMRKGRQDAARDLLDAGLALMEREAPQRFAFECSILLHNRAKLHRAMKQPERAIEDLTRLLRFEPSSGEAYFDRGLLQQRAGRHAAALADYSAALRWSPPYWEPHFNRAQVHLALGDRDAALRDYERVLVLNPAHVESRAHAFCLRGLIAMESGDLAEAERNFSLSIAADPRLADAWANRATIRFRQRDAEAALQDLDHALVLREDAETLYNRGRVLESLERRREAIIDYRRALALGVSGAEAIQRRLDHCLALEPDAHGQPATPAV
ncbi:tetratricopeptide repeat protein [Dongia sp.]|uniref:tetratricopeptide repeat protein n=1 Tax=Dongia sp. TaxID=1977262 RepID=UPI003750582F